MNIAPFVLYCIVVIFTPGPTNIVILSTVQSYGIKKALEYSYGATLAFGILLAASAILNTMLAAVIPKILMAMQILGTAYILYLAYQIYTMEPAGSNEKQAATFRSGFIMQFVNPKIALFTMMVIPGFVMPFYTAPYALTIFALMSTVIGFLAFVTWTFCGALFKEVLLKRQKLVNINMAAFRIYSAIMGSGLVELIGR